MRILSEFHDKRSVIANTAERLNAKREAEKSEVEKNIAKLSGAEKEAAQKEAAQKDAEQKELLNNEFKRLHSELASIESSTGQALKSQLSPEGEAKLHKYVMDLKQKIKILPGLPKPSATP
jgi:hypothetical protein